METTVKQHKTDTVSSLFKHIHDPTALSPGSLPVVDFSDLTAGDPDQRSKSIRDLAKACEEWGFFVLVNHGVPEELMDAAVSGIDEFFNLEEDLKNPYTAETLMYVGLEGYGHVVPRCPVYESMDMLRSGNGLVNTLATEGTKKFDFTVKNDIGDVKLVMKLNSTTITATLIDKGYVGFKFCGVYYFNF